MRSAAEPLYVVTLIDNVPSILIRGLLCRDELEKQCIPYRSERPYKGDPNEVTAWHGGTTSDKNPILFLDPCATYKLKASGKFALPGMEVPSFGREVSLDLVIGIQADMFLLDRIKKFEEYRALGDKYAIPLFLRPSRKEVLERKGRTLYYP